MEKLEPLYVCYTGNDRMFDGVLISSLSLAMVENRPLHVILLTADLEEYKKSFSFFKPEDGAFIEKALKQYNPDSVFEIIDAKKVFLDNFKKSVNLRSGYTPYAFMRLILDLLPNMPDKILYLDTDIIINKSIDELFALDLSQYDIAFAPDQVGRLYFGPHYGNSGVLLINLKKVREDGSFIKARWRVNHIKMFMPDQTALNIVCRKSKLILPNKYNEQQKLHHDTVIRHYNKRFYWLPVIHTVNIKPWDVEAFRNYFGHDTHKALLDEYTKLIEEHDKER